MKKITLLGAVASLLLGTTIQAQNWQLGGNPGVGAANWLGSANNAPLNFRTNNTQRMNILGTNGFVGVNTTAPQNRMHIHDATNVYSQHTTATATNGFWLGVNNLDAELRQKENAPMNFFTNDTERLQIAANGDVIIKNPNGIILLANDNKTYYRLTITSNGKIITELTQI